MKFCDNDKAFASNICCFDFAANKESRQFEPYVRSTERFANHFSKIVEEKTENVVCDVDLTVQAVSENALADDMAILENEQENTTTVSENEPSTSDTSRLLKRPAPKEIPEVDPLPSKINKQLRVTKPKLKNSPASDKDFLGAVKNNYLIKDGMCKTHTHIKNYIYKLNLYKLQS